MSAIRLTKSDLTLAAARMSRIFKKAVDTNDTRRVYDGEVKAFRGPGAAAVRRFWKATQMYAGRGEALSLVSLRQVENRILAAVKTLKKVADAKGNKDGVFDGSELKLVTSESAKALARFAHATK